MELRCWGGGWGLPSVHAESLVVLVTLELYFNRKYNHTIYRSISATKCLFSCFPDGFCVFVVSLDANFTAAVVLLVCALDHLDAG